MLFTKTNDIIKLQSEIKTLQRKLRFNGGDNPLLNRINIVTEIMVNKDQLEHLMKSQ